MKAIVLAAGRSSRFWPLAQEGHKSTYKVGYGKPVIAYTLEGLERFGIKEAAVIRAMADPYMTACLRNYASSLGNRTMKILAVEQAEAEGMGDAILAAEKFLGGLEESEQLLVLNASQINIYQILSKLHELNWPWPVNIMFGQKTDHPENFGVMRIREDARVLEVREKPKTFLSPIRVVGVYLLHRSFLNELKKHAGETSLEDALQAFLEDHGIVQGVVLPEEMPLLSLKYPWDLLAMNRYLMEHDSSLDDYLNNEEAIKNSVSIKAGVQFSGEGIVLSRGVTIYENAVIKGPCFIDEGAVIGNHCLIRDHSYIGKNVVVGAHSEVKNSILYDDIELHHNFIGDSILDKDCSLGAGTITANKRFDRKNVKSEWGTMKVDTNLRGLGAVVGAGAKVCINASLMPGVKIGRNVVIKPGEVVDRDIR